MRWKIEVRNYRCFTDEYPLKIDLSNPVTALIGPNNSGKSAALRFFWEIGRMIAQAPNALAVAYSVQGQAMLNNLLRPLSDPYSVFSALNDRPLVVDLFPINDGIPVEGLESVLTDKVKPAHVRLSISRTSLSGQVSLIHHGQQLDNVTEQFDTFQSPNGALFVEKSGLSQYFLSHHNNLYGLGQPTYIPAVRPYGKLSVDDNFELTLGRAIISGWNAHKAASHPASREFAASIEKELARIFGFQQLEIYPTNNQDDLLLRVDNGRSFQLQDMGTGIGQFLTLLLNMQPRGNPLILFDEPEIGMHASLQVELMSLIAKFASGPIVFATHSLGLARSVADDIISFAMTDGHSQPRKFEGSANYLETLGELSFSAWREIGCDGVLFVEGPSDVKVISEWLRKVGLGKRWALMSLGGSETINSDGVEAIRQVLQVHPRVAVVIDSERDAPDAEIENKRLKFSADCAAADIPCLLTEKRATENYFTERAVKAACGDNASALDAFDKLDGNGWGKRDGLKIASHMNVEEVEGTDVVRFIREQTPA
ncbi:AAA domain, group 15 [Sphingomonadaceae bacterium]